MINYATGPQCLILKKGGKLKALLSYGISPGINRGLLIAESVILQENEIRHLPMPFPMKFQGGDINLRGGKSLCPTPFSPYTLKWFGQQILIYRIVSNLTDISNYPDTTSNYFLPLITPDSQ